MSQINCYRTSHYSSGARQQRAAWPNGSSGPKPGFDLSNSATGYDFAFSRRAFTPECQRKQAPLKMRGRKGMPGDGLARCPPAIKKSWRQSKIFALILLRLIGLRTHGANATGNHVMRT
jgi:hypothetical protein